MFIAKQSKNKELKNNILALASKAKAAKEVGLKTLPYMKGFFICVPYKESEKLVNDFHQDGVYAIATHSAIRIALCGIN